MSRMIAVVLSAALAASAPLVAQDEARISPPQIKPTTGPEAHIERIAREVAKALAMDEEQAKLRLEWASTEARELARANPDHADAQYLVAASLGSLMDYQGARSKVSSANEVRRAAETALSLDPDHAGAHHVMGRLHAGGMRASRFVKIAARLFFGAEIFDDISWEMAEEHFRTAMALEPESPRHPMELGALLMDTGRPEEAERVLEIAVGCSGQAAGDSEARERAQELLDQMEGTRP